MYVSHQIVLTISIDAPKKRSIAQADAAAVAKRTKRVAGYCLCGGEDVGDMVKCEVCKGKQSWYHDDCLLKNDVELPERVAGKFPRGFKFTCPRCKMSMRARN
jgi:hypothetical protein